MSFIFLIQGVAMDMDLCEHIEKISDFFHHYQDHKEYDGDSFFEYLVEDYFNDHGDTEGHHSDSEHDQTPSHAQHQCCHQLVFVAPYNVIDLKSMSLDGNSNFDHYSFHFNSRYLESLFQPPKA